MLFFSNTPFLSLFTVCCLALSTICCDCCDEAVVTSPLVGAKRVERRGEDRVAEVLVTKGYAYLRLSSSKRGVWHVIAGDPPRVGETVRYRGYAEVHDYHSPSLDRQFPRLIFSYASPTLHK